MSYREEIEGINNRKTAKIETKQLIQALKAQGVSAKGVRYSPLYAPSQKVDVNQPIGMKEMGMIAKKQFGLGFVLDPTLANMAAVSSVKKDMIRHNQAVDLASRYSNAVTGGPANLASPMDKVAAELLLKEASLRAPRISKEVVDIARRNDESIGTASLINNTMNSHKFKNHADVKDRLKRAIESGGERDIAYYERYAKSSTPKLRVSDEKNKAYATRTFLENSKRGTEAANLVTAKKNARIAELAAKDKAKADYIQSLRDRPTQKASIEGLQAFTNRPVSSNNAGVVGNGNKMPPKNIMEKMFQFMGKNPGKGELK